MRRTSRYAHPSTVARMVRNIRKVYHQATDAEYGLGAGWYPNAVNGCNVWADRYGYDARTVASVIAALSPQCEWTSSLRAALNMVSGEYAPLTGASRPLQANIRKAERILSDRATLPDDYFVKGWKVRAFARNLQGDYQTVTVDTHAIQIALGSPTAVARVDAPSAYAAFEKAYVRAAALERTAPAKIQAITWITWKRLYSPGRKRAMQRRHA